jgi:chemotaxis protein methyltransferase CheR
VKELQSEVISISEEELRSLTDAIYLRHGIDFSCYEPKSLKRRVVRALHIFKLTAVHELWIKILKDRSFIYPFMDEISVGLTSMFRDPVLWKKIRSLVFTELSNTKELSIWHAGCSTGEEIYTMAIVLRESLYNKSVTAFATDISNQAIVTAQKGEYSLHKVEEFKQNYQQYNTIGSLKKYYKETDASILLDPSLINYVSFENHNLITSPFTRKFDIIFCRNVMIYFDNEAKRKLFDKFYESLNPNGLFIIGFYDAVLPLIDDTKFQVLDMDAKIFRKIQKTNL